jgi:hypothetical protein
MGLGIHTLFSLQRYEHHRCSVTIQLRRIDHGLRVCRIFLFPAPNPNSGIRADLCIVVLVRLEYIEDAGVDFLIVTLLLASVHIYSIIGLQAASRPTLRFSETSSTINVQLCIVHVA